MRGGRLKLNYIPHLRLLETYISAESIQFLPSTDLIFHPNPKYLETFLPLSWLITQSIIVIIVIIVIIIVMKVGKLAEANG